MLERLPKQVGLEDIWKELDRIREIQKESLRVQMGARPNSGQTWGCQLILTVNYPPIQLYFTTDLAQYNAIPKGQNVWVPTWPFRALVAINEGNADAMFDINRKPGDVRITTLLRAGENVQIPPTGGDMDKFSIFSFQAIAVVPGGPNPATIGVTSWGGDLSSCHLRLMSIT